MKHTDPKQIRRDAAREFKQSLGELHAVFEEDAAPPVEDEIPNTDDKKDDPPSSSPDLN
ncbi:MAG: hypothetical protein AAGF66_00255 [Cyanobacteria bacterium P01_H01_bin.119]